jgi:hypothetical protein
MLASIFTVERGQPNPICPLNIGTQPTVGHCLIGCRRPSYLYPQPPPTSKFSSPPSLSTLNSSITTAALLLLHAHISRDCSPEPIDKIVFLLLRPGWLRATYFRPLDTCNNASPLLPPLSRRYLRRNPLQHQHRPCRSTPSQVEDAE